MYATADMGPCQLLHCASSCSRRSKLSWVTMVTGTAGGERDHHAPATGSVDISSARARALELYWKGMGWLRFRQDVSWAREPLRPAVLVLAYKPAQKLKDMSRNADVAPQNPGIYRCRVPLHITVLSMEIQHRKGIENKRTNKVINARKYERMPVPVWISVNPNAAHTDEVHTPPHNKALVKHSH